jgi:hypothetical protein
MTNYNRPPGNRDEELQYERERAAENNGTANGLAIGGGIAALVGLGAALYYWSRPNPVPAPTTIINPPAVSPAASSSPQPPQPTKTIERTVERTTPPKVIEVPKPIIVPGATRTVEVQPLRPLLLKVPSPVLRLRQLLLRVRSRSIHLQRLPPAMALTTLTNQLGAFTIFPDATAPEQRSQ